MVPVDNTEKADTNFPDLPVIHLHGACQKWTAENFKNSCVLDAASYLTLPDSTLSGWLKRFEDDLEGCEIAVFIGTNMADFHLNRVIYNATGLREKIFFINRETAQADPNIEAGQRLLGTPFYFGRAGLAQKITALQNEPAPRQLHLEALRKVEPAAPASGIVTSGDIRDLFILGKVNPGLLARDIRDGTSNYHVTREGLGQMVEQIDQGARIFLINGYPCDGKTLLARDLARHLATNRPIYELRQLYDSLLNEVADILKHDPRAVLVLENCFDLPDARLHALAGLFDTSEGVLILTARSVASDASPSAMAGLCKLTSFRNVPVDRLSLDEARALSALADQIAGWSEFEALGEDAKLRFILDRDKCQASLPHFMMRLLKSKYVRDRYRTEFNSLALADHERQALIVPLFMAHIGESPPLNFYADIFRFDFGALLDRLNDPTRNGAFHLVRRVGKQVETIPSIGAENILHELFEDREVADMAIAVLKHLAGKYRNSREQAIFRQLMRFNIQRKVIADIGEIDRFYENAKQIGAVRRMPLFWLQWHMAKLGNHEFAPAETLLKQGYSEARRLERIQRHPYDRRQLDDRRAHFLMKRAQAQQISGKSLFDDFKEATGLIDKILRQDNPQHYPFVTLQIAAEAFIHTRTRMGEGLAQIIHKRLLDLEKYARRRLPMVPERYQAERAEPALAMVDTLLE